MINQPLILVILLFVELLSLFFVSKLLVKSLGRLFYFLTKSQTQTIQLFAILFLPGTIIHELAHVVMAGILMVPHGDIEFMPEIQGDKIKLGTAQIGQTDIIRRMLIGVAPIIFGTLLLLGSLFYFWQTFFRFGQFGFGQVLILIYLVFVLGNTMFSSNKDLEGTLEALGILIAAFLAFYLTKFYLPFEILGKLITPQFISFLEIACLFILVPIVVDILLYAVIHLFLRKRLS